MGTAVQAHAHACTDVMSGFVRGPQTHDGVPILLLSLGPGGPIPTGSPKFYDTGVYIVFLPLITPTFPRPLLAPPISKLHTYVIE